MKTKYIETAIFLLIIFYNYFIQEISSILINYSFYNLLRFKNYILSKYIHTN